MRKADERKLICSYCNWCVKSSQIYQWRDIALRRSKTLSKFYVFHFLFCFSYLMKKKFLFVTPTVWIFKPISFFWSTSWSHLKKPTLLWYWSWKHLFRFQLGCIVMGTLTSQQEGRGFKYGLGPFCLKFACSPQACVNFLRALHFFQQSKNMQVEITGDNKLPQVIILAYVIVCVNCDRLASCPMWPLL